MIKRPPTTKFRGLNTVSDPLRLNLSWLTQADNVDVTDTGQLVRCDGYARSTTNAAIAGAYATQDLQRLYVIDSGELRQLNADLTYSVLRTGLSAAKYYFEEVNGVVYYTNGTDYGIIEPAGARAWGVPTPGAPAVTAVTGSLDAGICSVVCTFVDDRGLESANSEVTSVLVGAGAGLAISAIEQLAGYTTRVYATTPGGTVFYLLADNAPTALVYNGGELGPELPFWNLDTPRGSLPTMFQGRMHLAEAFPQQDLSHIWRSLPLQFHHYDVASESVAVPGTVRMLRSTPAALIIGTDRAIHAWDGERLTVLADYGVVPGHHAQKRGDEVYFWTLRGAAMAMPFRNLTEDTVSVAPGLTAGACVMEKGGAIRYVVALQTGGAAFNARTT